MLLLIPVLMCVIVHNEVLTQRCTDSPPAVGEGAYLKFTSTLITCLKSLKVSYKPQNSSKFIDVLTCVMIGGNSSCHDHIDLKYEFVNCSRGSLVIKIHHATKQCEGIYNLSVVQEKEVVACNLTLSDNKTLHINESDRNKNPVQTTSSSITTGSEISSSTSTVGSSLGSTNYNTIGIACGSVAAAAVIAILILIYRYRGRLRAKRNGQMDTRAITNTAWLEVYSRSTPD